MKNIKIKFKINFFTYLFLIASFCAGLFKNSLLILSIVLFHELGHVFFMKRKEYPIHKIEIFPFGGITTVEKPVNTPIKTEIIIALGGVLFQLLLSIFFLILWKQDYIRENTYILFQNYNKIILIFNLLPIIPLDGSIIIHSILEYFFSYQKAYSIYLGISILTLIGFITFHTLNSLNNYMILTFLIYKLYEEYKERKLIQNKFYLERYLYELPYTKIESHAFPDISRLKKDTLHFFWKQDRYLHEKEFLKYYYFKNNFIQKQDNAVP